MITNEKPRIAPNSKEFEMIVLGCMLTSVNGLNIASESLDESDFYYVEHKIIFQVLQSAYKSDKPADVYLVCEELRKLEQIQDVGGAPYITTLAQYAGTSSYIEEYVRNVKEYAIRRKLIDVGQKLIQQGFDQEDPSKIITQLEKKLDGIKTQKAHAESAFQYLLENNSKEKMKKEIKEISQGISTGYTIGEIKLKIPGGALTILAAPTGHGKTTALINFSLGAIKQHDDKSVYFFSYEENGSSILSLFLNTWIGEDLSKNNRKSIENHFRDENVEFIKPEMRQIFLQKEKAFFEQCVDNGRLRVFYTDMSTEGLVASIRFIKQKTNVGLVCIDYIQFLKLLKGTPANRQGELKEICLMLKDCAVETGLPILVAAQFNRTVTAESLLSSTSIGEAGDIERAASMIIGMWNRNCKTTDSKACVENGIYMEVLKGRKVGIGHSSIMMFNGNAGKLSNQAYSNTNSNIKNHDSNGSKTICKL